MQQGSRPLLGPDAYGSLNRDQSWEKAPGPLQLGGKGAPTMKFGHWAMVTLQSGSKSEGPEGGGRAKYTVMEREVTLGGGLTQQADSAL